MLIAFLILFILFVLFVISTVGRSGHPGLSVLRQSLYAHRGLHGNGAPENSLEAFRRAKDAGYGVELDVHLLKDGNLAVFHDSDLLRMTGKSGKITDLETDDLVNYHLLDSNCTIPTFRQVLELFDGKVPMIVELKSTGNYPELCEKTCAMLDTYNGPYCLESFDPRCVYWLRKNRPDLIRGQLTENYLIKRKAKLPLVLRFVLKHQMFNFLTKPDFVAYRFSDRKTVSNFFCRKLWGVQGVTWTIKTKKSLNTAIEEGWIPIFEGFEP